MTLLNNLKIGKKLFLLVLLTVIGFTALLLAGRSVSAPIQKLT